jgi:superoxide dismutase, Fe-Mn family
MFGPGFVWLAKNHDREGLLHIFCTYNAGSPYPSAHARRQSIDMNTHDRRPSVDTNTITYARDSTPILHGRQTTVSSAAPGSIHVNPILCVNTWEHVWMMDYGIAGKAEFLERWWNHIDWEIVYDKFDQLGSRFLTNPADSGRIRRGRP